MPTKEELLKSLTVKQLRQLAKENRVSLKVEGWFSDGYATTKEEMIEILLESSRITRKKILETLKPTPKPKQKKEAKREAIREISKKGISARGILNKIKRFPPPTKPKREKQLENMLVSYLRAFYDVRTQLAYERTRIDAKIGTIGIEIKYQPSVGDFDRLYSQVEKYLKYLTSVIIVIGSEKSKDLTRDFKRRLKEREWLNKRAFVITI